MDRPTGLLVASAVALLLAGGCSDDDDAAPAEATTTSDPTTTTAAPTTTTTPATTTACATPLDPAVLATADLDGDGVDERFVSAGFGASVEIVELREVVGCDLEAVTVGGMPVQFAIGGSVTHLNGLRCDDGQLVELAARSDDGERYTTTTRTFELQGDDLVLVDEQTGELEATSPELDAYTRLDC